MKTTAHSENPKILQILIQTMLEEVGKGLPTYVLGDFELEEVGKGLPTYVLRSR